MLSRCLVSLSLRGGGFAPRHLSRSTASLEPDVMKNQSQNIIGFFDLLGAVTAGLFIGYERQRLADSGEYLPNKILISVLIGGSSYFLAFVLCNRRNIWRLPSWFIVAVVGSAVCFLNLHVIKFAVDNWSYRESDSVFAYLAGQLSHYVGGFFILTPIYSIVALFIIGAAHFIGWLLVNYGLSNNSMDVRQKQRLS